MTSPVSVDDFSETNSVVDFKPLTPHHTIRSGRQRKKTAARSKGGEFQTKRRKRRIYFCSIGSEIDVEGLADRFLTSEHLGFRGKMFSEVLHLYVENEAPAVPSKNDPDERFYDHQNENLLNTAEDLLPKSNVKDTSLIEVVNPLSDYSNANFGSINNPHRKSLKDAEDHDLSTIEEGGNAEEEDEITTPTSVLSLPRLGKQLRSSPYPESNDDDLYQFHHRPNSSYELEHAKIGSTDLVCRDDHVSAKRTHRLSINYPNSRQKAGVDENQANSHYWRNGGREVFVFDFGAVVFWGYRRNEVKDLLQFFRSYVVKGRLSEEEFKAGEDDIAFVLSPDTETITIANDVVTLPEITPVKSRLAVSFAIAQSTILAIFEARIEKKIDEYKYIPETLASLGKMID
eukprot:gene12769-13995_t